MGSISFFEILVVLSGSQVRPYWVTANIPDRIERVIFLLIIVDGRGNYSFLISGQQLRAQKITFELIPLLSSRLIQQHLLIILPPLHLLLHLDFLKISSVAGPIGRPTVILLLFSFRLDLLPPLFTRLAAALKATCFSVGRPLPFPFPPLFFFVFPVYLAKDADCEDQDARESREEHYVRAVDLHFIL